MSQRRKDLSTPTKLFSTVDSAETAINQQDLSFEHLISNLTERENLSIKADTLTDHGLDAFPKTERVAATLPHKNVLSLLSIKPDFLFIYWHISPSDMIKSSESTGRGSKLNLRLYDSSRSKKVSECKSWDIEIFDQKGNLFLKKEDPDQSLYLDIGMKDEVGKFAQIVSADLLEIAPEMISHAGPLKWILKSPVKDSSEMLKATDAEYITADLDHLKRIMGAYFYDMLMRGLFLSKIDSTTDDFFRDLTSLSVG